MFKRKYVFGSSSGPGRKIFGKWSVMWDGWRYMGEGWRIISRIYTKAPAGRDSTVKDLNAGNARYVF